MTQAAADERTESLVESLPALLARATDRREPKWLIEGLIPGEGITMEHGQPRNMKSLIASGVMLSLTTGSPAFGLERLAVPERVPCAYFTEEDGWHAVARRFRALMVGASISTPPDILHICAGKGLSLDHAEAQDRVIDTIRSKGIRVVVFDPLRSLTDAADQGPRELRPFTLFLRRLIRETGCVPLVVHHDQKPQPGVVDTRRRAQRASGGGIFAIADSPIGIDRVDDQRVMLVPCAYKFSADPAPITVRLDHGEGWLRLVGEDSTATDLGDATVDRKILEFLEHSPYSFGSNVAKGARIQKGHVLRRLVALETQGLIDSTEEARGTKWFRTKAV